MKRIGLFLSALMTLTMAGCREVPEDVKSRTEESRVDVFSDAELEKVSVNALQNDANAAIKQSYSQFKFRDGLTVELPNELYECSFIQQEGMEQRYEEVFSKLYDEELLSKITILDDDWVENEGVPLTSPDMIYTTPARGFRSDELREHCFLHSSGFLCFYRPSTFSDPGYYETEAIYFADRGDDLSDSYELDGGSMTVAEVVDFAQKWVNENYAYLEPQYTLKVKTVEVHYTYDDDYCYVVEVEKSYKGIHLNSVVSAAEYDETDSLYGTMNMKHITNTLTLNIRKPNEVSMFTNGNGMILPKEGQKLDQVISLSSIMPYLSRIFADFSQVMEISEIGLKYTLSPEYDYQNVESYFHPGININSRLVWEILVDVPIEGRPQSYSSTGRMVKYIQVDALTGEIEFDFEPFAD